MIHHGTQPRLRLAVVGPCWLSVVAKFVTWRLPSASRQRSPDDVHPTWTRFSARGCRPKRAFPLVLCSSALPLFSQRPPQAALCFPQSPLGNARSAQTTCVSGFLPPCSAPSGPQAPFLLPALASGNFPLSSSHQMRAVLTVPL